RRHTDLRFHPARFLSALLTSDVHQHDWNRTRTGPSIAKHLAQVGGSAFRVVGRHVDAQYLEWFWSSLWWRRISPDLHSNYDPGLLYHAGSNRSRASPRGPDCARASGR